MQKIKWNYSVCVACGKCFKACYEANNKVLCYFNTFLNNENYLYEWICNQNSLAERQCDYVCKDICPKKALI